MIKMKLKKILCAVVAVATIGTLVCGCGGETSEPDPGTSAGTENQAAELEDITISFAIFHTESALDSTEFIQPWMAEVQKACAQVGYNLEFECYYGETLVALPDTYQAVVDGTVDMGWFLTPMAGIFSLEDVCVFPTNGTEVYRTSRIYQDLYYEFEEIQAEWDAVKVIGLVGETPQLCMSNSDFTSLAESKGLQWCSTGAICNSIVSNFGWGTVSAGPTDIYSYGERGMLDGCGSSAKNVVSNAWYEVYDKIYNFAVTNNTDSIIMNKQTWESLPAEVQKVFDDYGLGSGNYVFCDMYDEAMQAVEAEYLEKLFTEYGMTYVELDDAVIADFQAQVDKAAQDWAAGLDAEGKPGTEILTKYYELVEKYSAEEYASWE